ncbi:MAG: CHAT domain-containing protein [Bacteroidales bacterium]|nr:CHAT domain-containing protein [Bacteroidales bacterium]
MHFLNSITTFRVFFLFTLSFTLEPVTGQTSWFTEFDYKKDSLVNCQIRNYEFEKALQAANECSRISLHESQRKAFWLFKTAAIYYAQGNLASGNEKLKEAKVVMQQVKDPDHLLQFYDIFLQGRRFRFAGNRSEALQCFRRAEAHSSFISKKHPHELAWLYRETGYMLYLLDSYSDAIHYYDMAIQSIPGNTFIDLHEINTIKVKQADAYWNTKEKDKSLKLVQNCLAYIDTAINPLHPALMEVYLNLTTHSFNFFDNYSTARDLLRDATRILEKFFPADHFYAGMLYTKKSDMEYRLSDFENTLQYSKHALQILSKYAFLNYQKQLNYQNIARIYYWLERDYENTIHFSRQAIDSLESAGMSPAYLYYMIGLSYLQLKNIPLALENLKKVISLSSDHKKSQDDYCCSRAYQELGNICLRQNNLITGRYYLQTALTYAKRISTKGYAVTNINMNLGRSYMTTHDYRMALIYLQRSIMAGCQTFADTMYFANPALEDIFLTQNLIRPLTEKAYTLYLLYEKKGNLPGYLESAFSCQELAVRLIERRLADMDEERSELILSDIKKRAMNNAVSYATLLYMKTGEREYADKAWEYAEKSKMQVLSINTMKMDHLLYSGLPDSLIRKHERLHHEILSIENQLALLEKNEDSDVSGEEALAKLTGLYDQREELTIRLGKEYPAYARLKYKFTVAGIDQLQEFLEKDQAIVEYQVLSTEIITFVITKSDYAIYFQLIDKKIFDNIAKLRQMISSDPLQTDPMQSFQAFISSSAYLYQKLIEPIYDRIEGKRLLIVPHNQLTQIPFEVLIREEPEKDQPDYRSLHYLIREFPVAYAFSANLLVDNNHKKFGSGTAIFLPEYSSSSGNSNRDSLLANLDGAAYEAREIRRLTGGKLFSRNRADESTFKAKAHLYRILHISSHSIMNVQDPDLSCLVMATPHDTMEDGNLYSYEISQLKLKAQLVVLSGCNTGYGWLLQNEGLISIARSFLYTGIRTVAYTLWPLADKAGADLISSFYRALRSRLPLDKAMRKTKLSYLEKADPVMAHPYYWSGYIVAGKTDTVPVFRFAFWMIVLLSSATVILLFYFILRKINH